MIELDQPSFQSVLLEAQTKGLKIGTATGFIVNGGNGRPLLITNWHVVTGRHIESRQVLDPKGQVPDALIVFHNAEGELGTWITRAERLYDDAGDPHWLEHPVHGPLVDVVGVPLTDLKEVAVYPYSYSGPSGHGAAELPTAMKWGPSDFLNVIGFPFGWTAGGAMGIWVQVAIASEPELDFKGLPRFLIDSRTREGQSGSPVVIYKRNGWVTLDDGRLFMIHNVVTLLVGVYSGRLNRESDLGTVWKTSIVKEIAERGVRGVHPDRNC